MTIKPEFYAPDLTDERLMIICEKLLDVLDEAEGYSESPNATAWVKGTLTYGLPQGMFIGMHLDKRYPWLTLANKTMDYTIRIGNTLVQVVVDDPYTPRKQHRLKRNLVEQYQCALNLEHQAIDTSLIWRIYLNPMSNGIDYSPSISVLGFDSNHNIVCQWEHNVTITGPKTNDIPAAVEIKEPILTRKQGKQQKNENEKEQ